MPIGYSSIARNLFLLGSSGSLIDNFFKLIDQSSTTNNYYQPSGIIYDDSDGKYLLAGIAKDENLVPNKDFGWFEKRDYDSTTDPANPTSTTDWDVRVESSSSGVNTVLRDIQATDTTVYAAGKTGNIPWIAKYNSTGVQQWTSTSNTADVEYRGISIDSNGNAYACGNTNISGESVSFVEKFDSSGNPGWGTESFMVGRDVSLSKIAANTRGEVVAAGFIEDDTADKGYIVKIDTTTGQVLWDRTLSFTDKTDGTSETVRINDIKIDDNDRIYIVGEVGINSFVVKYTPEGNLLWQKQTGYAFDIVGVDISHVSLTVNSVTQDITVASSFASGGIVSTFLSNYNRRGDLIWRREISQGITGVRDTSLDNEGAFIYFIFDPGGSTGDQYTFGKVSATGNGLGNFQYDDGTTTALINYNYINSVSLGDDDIGRLSDGSVTNSVSDLITYPFSANKIVFDDLSTHISNKKRQMDSADSFEYDNGSAIRIAPRQELNLLGENVSDRIWTDTSGKGNNGVASLTEPFFGAGSVSFDGTGDHLLVDTSTSFDYGTNDFTIEFWWYRTSNDRQALFHGSWGQDWSIGIDFNGSANNQKLGMWASSSGTSWDMLIADAGGNGITTGTPALNQWSHIAYVRNGSDFQLYLNGTSVGQVTNSSAINSKTTTRQQAIGAWWNSEIAMSDVHGYLSNYRIVIGSALYTSNFTPPTTQLTNIPGTVLLTCQGNTIADASANNFTITVNGNAAPTDDGPTHNAAGYWEFATSGSQSDGFTGDYIEVDYDTNLIPTGFTLEFWFNGIDTRPGQAAQFIATQGFMGGGADNDSTWRIERNNTQAGTIEFNVNNGSGFNQNELVSTNFPDGTWHHCVCIFYNGTSTIYKNGVQDVQSTSYSGTPTHPAVDHVLRIGARYDNAPYAFNGSIGEVRIYPRALTAAQVYQNYNATKETYTGVAANTNPGLTSTRTP